jgi:hypothetical protein
VELQDTLQRAFDLWALACCAGIGKSELYEKKFTSKDYKKTGLVFRV